MIDWTSSLHENARRSGDADIASDRPPAIARPARCIQPHRRLARRPLALVAFTNEEGSRFPPYAMGSLVYVGGLALEEAYAVRGIDGATVGEELRRIGYAGNACPGFLTPHAYLELHIEQGPILE